MWNTVFERLHPGARSSDAEIARAEAELGFALPESYRSFCRDCGAGLANGHFRIATPLPYPAADLMTRAEIIADSINAAIAALSATDAPHRFAIEDGDLSRLARACFFGEGEDGSFLFWDVAGAGEYPIWVMAADLETVRFGGDSLDAFFRRTQGLTILDVLVDGTPPLASTFEGIEAAVLARAGEASPPGEPA
ncbi:SMI1/KNR4 family protein [Methylobacterium sp. J-059]|uniref:SMI1/KNR4 family protein n=1 Tax=Methylobacterium sp. J-059 TaxID=2836643 RepID=UPI001FBC09D5|nr:SMI1/KNR4 family protein [Methylobacterium sp. J-059]MCJ2042816.1 SMI1/KNR4 family protein [Methylobacterium sp. J-059]